MRVVHKEDIYTITQLFNYLDAIYTQEKEFYQPSLHLMPSIPELKIDDEKLKRLLKFRGLIFQINQRSRNLYFAYLGKKIEEPFYIISSDTNFLVFLTDIEGHKARNVLRTFLRNAKPYLDSPILFQDDLFNLLDNLSQDYDEVKFLEGTLKSEGETQRKWKLKETIYDRSELEEICERESARLSSLAIQCKKDDLRLKFRIYDDGWMTLYRGSFVQFFEDITKPLLRIVSHSKKMFKEVEMSSSDDSAFRVIRFRARNRLSITQIKTLKNTISKRYISSVIHEGNPFLQIDVIDREDYSSMSVYAYNDYVEIVPSRKVSSAALIDLASLILDSLPTLTLM